MKIQQIAYHSERVFMCLRGDSKRERVIEKEKERQGEKEKETDVQIKMYVLHHDINVCFMIKFPRKMILI